MRFSNSNLYRYNVLFAVLLPLLIVCVFGAGAVALLAGLWGVSHVAGVDLRQRTDLERRVKAEELGKFQGRRGGAVHNSNAVEPQLETAWSSNPKP